MKNWFLILALATLASFSASAQIPRTLQIGMTNGMVVLSTETSPGFFYGELETTTNLSPPIGWSGTIPYMLESNENDSISATNPSSFYRLRQTYPIFQFAIFYNLDLELNPGNQMTINGPVHSEANIYTTGNSSANNLSYASYVQAVQQIYFHRSTNDPNTSGSSNYVFFSITNNNPISNSGSLSTFLPTNSPAAEDILNLPPPGFAPPNSNAYSPTGAVYLYNFVDLIVSNNPANSTNFVFYENPNAASPVSAVLPDSTNIVSITSHGVTTHYTNAFYSYVTNATFYDYRETKTVQAIQIDVAKLRSWLTNLTATGGAQYNQENFSGPASKGRAINSLYVYNSAPLMSSQLPAVRLVNGQQLPPAGFTVATPQPLYVKGDYNITTDGVNFAKTLGSTTNGYTVPAAIMGDAVTILSSNWSDSYNSGTSISSRTAASTTINAAVLEGIVQSLTDSSGTKHYSGGVENFLRLLEDWGNGPKTLTYNGAIVVMFPSQYATNFWSGNYYGVPQRLWGFDTTFSQAGKLPPLTPMVANFLSP